MRRMDATVVYTERHAHTTFHFTVNFSHWCPPIYTLQQCMLSEKNCITTAGVAYIFIDSNMKPTEAL